MQKQGVDENHSWRWKLTPVKLFLILKQSSTGDYHDKDEQSTSSHEADVAGAVSSQKAKINVLTLALAAPLDRT